MVPKWTWVGDLLGRLGIIVLFSQGALVKGKAWAADVSAWMSGAADASLLAMLSEAANLAFLLLIITTTVFRLPPIRGAQGIEARVTALLGTFAMGVLVLLPPQIEVSPALRVLGLCLMLTGFSLSVYVLWWLGRSFSIMAEARRLVTGGPYAIVRHPLYATEEIAIIGMLLLHPSLAALGLVVLQWLVQLRRMHHEEKVLSAAFPDYEAYAAGTPRVIPKLLAAPLRTPA